MVMRLGERHVIPAELRKELQLSEIQREKLAGIHERQMRHRIEARAQLELASLDLAKLLHADPANERAIDGQIDRIAGLRASLQKSRVASMLEARAVLTPEQRKIIHEHRHFGLGDFMGRGHGRERRSQ